MCVVGTCVQCVMDSYDYAKALGEVLPLVAAKQIGKGGYMILRPDSGDPNEAVLMVCVVVLILTSTAVAAWPVYAYATQGNGRSHYTYQS